MDKKEIKAKIEGGWIRINMIFELVGNPKKHVEDTLRSYMANIRTDTGVEIISEDYGEAEEVSKGLFSTFVESEMLVQDLEKLTWLSFNFAPASIEILEPVEFKFGAANLQNWINDLLAQLHQLGAMSKQISSQNKLLVNNMNRVIKNAMMLCITMGFDTPKDIAEKTGIDQKQLKPFFESLMREGRLSLHENQYKKVDKKGPKTKGKKK